MPHVPCSALSFSALISKNDFITGTTSRFEGLGMMPTTVKSSIPPKVNEIDEKLSANTADKASRMPESCRSCSTRSNCNFPGSNSPTAFPTSATMGTLHLASLTPTQSLTFPLPSEHPEFSFLFFTQATTIPCFIVVRR